MLNEPTTKDFYILLNRISGQLDQLRREIQTVTIVLRTAAAKDATKRPEEDLGSPPIRRR
jgi:hypothetical protein